MKKKFWFFFTVTVALFAMVFSMYIRYIHQSEYRVFVESFDHGVITIDSQDTMGTDEKYSVLCKKGQNITLNINPERTDTTYYNLKKLYVNGEDVTDEVNMLQYKTTVDSKMTILASFKKGTRPENDKSDVSSLDIEKPELLSALGDGYLGSFASYDIKDPTIIYDDKSGYYYCFGSDNVVIKSTDLVNWGGRTTYFESDISASSNAIMSFSAFDSVYDWSIEHGYGKDELYSDKNEDRTPLAPDIVKVDGSYYLYFSLSKSAGANESAIFCVKTTNLADAITYKRWEDVGLVISSCGRHGGTYSVLDENGESKKEKLSTHYDKANAVHPNVIVSDDGMFMSYGSYYGQDKIEGAIYILELNRKTGLLKKDSICNSQGEIISTLHGNTTYRSGTLLANPGRVPSMTKKDGSLVSGSEIIYNKDSGYYYMFVTYGVGDANYNIRVARSKNITGPYTDMTGQSMADFSSGGGKSQYDKGTLLLGGYTFTNSSQGGVLYTNTGRASIGSPCVIKTKNGNWYVASQSQAYYKVGSEITAGAAKAEELEVMNVNPDSALEIRELLWTTDEWPMAEPEVFSGRKAKTNIKKSSLYGNWDIIVFDREGSAESFDTVERSESSLVTIHESAVITAKDIKKGKSISTEGVLKKDNGYYTITIDGVGYKVYPTALWDWELGEGSIVFTGYGDNGGTIWGKKNISGALGIYTDAFYHMLSICDAATKETYQKKIDKISSNPSQSTIDSMTDKLIDIYTATAE